MTQDKESVRLSLLSAEGRVKAAHDYISEALFLCPEVIKGQDRKDLIQATKLLAQVDRVVVRARRRFL